MPETRIAAARTAVLLLVGCLLATLLSAAPASAAPSTPSQAAAASKGEVTFGVQPASVANGKIGPDARPYFYYGVSAGAALTDHVAILNYSTKPLSLTVYAADAVNAVDGGFGLQPVEKAPVDAGSWISLGGPRLQVRVPARSVNKAGQQVVGSVLLPMRISIPKGADPGDHVGGLVASLDSVSSDKDGNKVKLEQRVAARVFIRVAGPLHPSLVVRNLQVKYHGSSVAPSGGTATVSYTVRNTGNVKLGGRQQVTVGGLLGLHGKTAPVADIPLLLPGNSAQVSVRVSRLVPQLRMTASVKVTALQLPGDSNPSVPVARASVHFWAIPWLVLGIVAVLLLAAIGYLVNRRRGGSGGSGGDHRVSRPQGGPDGDPVEPDGAPVGRHSVMARTAVLGLSFAISLFAAPVAHAADLPYQDPAVTGQLGLCDRSGHPVTGGSITARPFVWRAVSSVAAPQGYGGAGRKASLLIYQPRPGVSADNWSGDQMTATSDYTNPAAPMSQATDQDFTLQEYLGEFKPMVNGLLQLRMYFGIPGRGTWNSSYPAINIKVSGDSWQVVDPANVSCTNGSSTSAELMEPVKLPVTQTSAPAGTAQTGKPTTSVSERPSASTARTSAATAVAPASSQARPVAATVTNDLSARQGSAWPLVGIVVLAIAALCGAGLWWRNRQSA